MLNDPRLDLGCDRASSCFPYKLHIICDVQSVRVWTQRMLPR